MKLKGDLLELEEELRGEQDKVEEIKVGIDRSKETMVAHNQDIARRALEKEQKEQQVCACIS